MFDKLNKFVKEVSDKVNEITENALANDQRENTEEPEINIDELPLKNIPLADIRKLSTSESLKALYDSVTITPEHYKYYLEDYYLSVADKVFVSKDAIVAYYKNVVEKMRIPDLSSMLKCSQNQMQKIFRKTQTIADLFGVKQPDVYIFQLDMYGAAAEGLSSPWIELYSRSYEDMTDEELSFMIGREIGHIQCNHLLYKILIDFILDAAGYLNNIPGIGTLLNLIGPDRIKQSLRMVLYPWNRASEYTADCAGYLATGGNLLTSCNAILKSVVRSKVLADQSCVKDFYAQVKEIDSMTGYLANYSKRDDVVPYGQYRIRELIRYASSERGLMALKKVKSWEDKNAVR